VLLRPPESVNTSQPELSGTAEAGSVVTVSVDGLEVGTATTTPFGLWSLTPASPLAQGAHTVVAIATDAAGNTSEPSALRSFTVDTSFPPVPVLTAPAALVNTATPVISGTAEPGSTVTVQVDGLEVGTVTATSSGSWSLTPTSHLTQGAHVATARAVRVSGSTSELSAPRGFTVDSLAPAAPRVVTPAEGETVMSGELVFSGSAEAGSTVTVMVDGVVVGTTTADPAGAWSVDSLRGLAQGSYTMTATATDEAGNISPASSGRAFTMEAQSCGCASSPTGGMSYLLGVLALWFWGRRNRAMSP
jgi:hypothetical protein